MEYIYSCKSYAILNFIFCFILTIALILKKPNPEKKISPIFIIGLMVAVFLIPAISDFKFYSEYANGEVKTERISVDTIVSERKGAKSRVKSRYSSSRRMYRECIFINTKGGNKLLLANEYWESAINSGPVYLSSVIEVDVVETGRYKIIKNIRNLDRL